MSRWIFILPLLSIIFPIPRIASAEYPPASRELETIYQHVQALESRLRELEAEKAARVALPSPVSTQYVPRPLTPATAISSPGPIPQTVGEYHCVDRSAGQTVFSDNGGPAQHFSSGYDHGWYFKTDRGIDLKFNALTQIWLDTIDNDASAPLLGGGRPSDSDTFLLRRAELKFSGHLGQRVGWRVMFDPARGIGGRGAPTEAFPQTKRILKDLFVDYQFVSEPWGLLDSATLRVGQQKLPVTMSGYHHSGALDFTERSVIGFTFGDRRDPGTLLFGTLARKRLEYYFMVYNGNGSNTLRDENDPFDLAGRAVWHPLRTGAGSAIKDLAVGGWFQSGGGDGFGGGKFNQDAVGVEGNLQLDNTFVRGEWVRGRRAQATFATPRQQGWYIATGYDITPHWQPVARYEQFDQDLNVAGDFGKIVTLGLNYFFQTDHDYNHHGAKIQAAYSSIDTGKPIPSPTGFLSDTNQFAVNFQVDF